VLANDGDVDAALRQCRRHGEADEAATDDDYFAAQLLRSECLLSLSCARALELFPILW
jgi:hypothetical protein